MEEQSEEMVTSREHVDGHGGEDSGARVVLRLPRPEQIVLVPQLPRAEPWREDHPPSPHGCQLRRLLRLLLLRLVALRLVALLLVALRGHGGGGEGGRRHGGWGRRWRRGRSRERRGFLRTQGAMKTMRETAPVSSAFKGEGGGRSAFPIKEQATISPTTPQSTRAVREGCGGYRRGYGLPWAARARALSWA